MRRNKLFNDSISERVSWELNFLKEKPSRILKWGRKTGLFFFCSVVLLLHSGFVFAVTLERFISFTPLLLRDAKELIEPIVLSICLSNP